jgi:predicted nucleotidyltransferase
MKPNLAIQELFYNHPTKQWHFEELMKTAQLSRAQTNEWLKKLMHENMIKRIKSHKKMPYYIAHYTNPHYQNSKRLYALGQLHTCGLFDYLSSLDKARVIILFGSFSRWDWYEKSDVDIFVYGDIDVVPVGKFMVRLKREIQLFSGKNKKDLQRIGPVLLKNIINGIIIKGALPREVITHAAV